MSADQTTSPDVLTSQAKITAGDYIGPWLWNELYAGVNVLTATMLNLSLDSREHWQGVSGPQASHAAARAAAIADWQHVASIYTEYVFTHSVASAKQNSPGLPWFYATLDRQQAHYTVGGSDVAPRTAQIYVYAYRPGHAPICYGDHGDGYAEDTFNLIHDGPVDPTTAFVVGNVNPAVQPTWHPGKLLTTHQWMWLQGHPTVLNTWAFDYHG